MKFKIIVPAIFLFVLFGFRQEKEAIPQLGICYRLDQDSLVYASGFRLIGESVGRMLAPSVTEEQFQQNVLRIKNAKCKVFLCNVF